MTTRLTDEQRHAVDEHHGFLEVEGGEAVYVVMSLQVYREMMGVGSEAEYHASIDAIREGLEDVEAGRTRSVEDFFQDLDRKHGLPR
jgi:PHD/YefM family antitoxin component YafN of YafNO toxin-antitoxin module